MKKEEKKIDFEEASDGIYYNQDLGNPSICTTNNSKLMKRNSDFDNRENNY